MAKFSHPALQVACILFLVALISNVAVAETAIRDISFTAQADSVDWLPLSDIIPQAVADENGLFSDSGILILDADGTRIDWTISGDVDPVLDGIFTVQNYANVPVTFTLSFNMNSMAMAAPTQTSGSIDIELTDVNQDGATLTGNGTDPVYMSLIDGVDHESLLDSSVYTLIAPAYGTANDSASFAVAGGAVASTLGTDLVFTLSAGDLAVINSNFTVVPEPTSLAMLAAGLIGLLTLSLRRRK